MAIGASLEPSFSSCPKDAHESVFRHQKALKSSCPVPKSFRWGIKKHSFQKMGIFKAGSVFSEPPSPSWNPSLFWLGCSLLPQCIWSQYVRVNQGVERRFNYSLGYPASFVTGNLSDVSIST